MVEESKQVERAGGQQPPSTDQPLQHKYCVWAMVKQQRQHN